MSPDKDAPIDRETEQPGDGEYAPGGRRPARWRRRQESAIVWGLEKAEADYCQATVLGAELQKALARAYSMLAQSARASHANRGAILQKTVERLQRHQYQASSSIIRSSI